MTLGAGSRVGAYEVVDKLGAGGMGEVYLARDTTLDRQAAIKVLPASVASEPDRLARFEREAKALAALNHPNIAQVYGVERLGDESSPAIVMEYVPGEDLSQVLARGAVAPDEALAIARQIAAALEAAHGAGIVHRDLKPANVKLRPDGTVKVLDFGLAKAGDPATTSSVSAMNSPTLTARATELGVILGTAAYMAPEQAKGRATDRRVDVWAFGVVLYEMLTGRRAFGGDDVTEVMAAVIRDTPSLDSVPPATPRGIRRLLERCLQKDPAKRLRDMGDVGLEIDEAIAGEPDDRDAPGAAPGPARPSPGILAAGALALAAIASGLTWWMTPEPVLDLPVARFEHLFPENTFLMNTAMRSVAVSRDGRHVAWVSENRLFVRDLDLPGAREVAELSGGSSGFAFSPDGSAIALASLACTCLTRYRIAGGPSQPLAQDVEAYGVYWTDDGRILVANPGGIFAIPESGGQPDNLVAPASDVVDTAIPQLLPGGRFVLYTSVDADGAAIVVQPVDGGPAQVVLDGVSGAQYVTSGHLVYGEDQRLMAIAFDLDRLQTVGSPVTLTDSVTVSTQTGVPQLAVSDNGTLVLYAPSGNGENQLQLVWADEDGVSSPAFEVPRRYSDPRLSPDGRRVALHLWDDDNDVWIADLQRGDLTRLTFDPREDETPVWSADGQFVAYSSDRDDGRIVARKRVGGNATEPEEVLWQGPQHVHVTDWAPDGNTLLIQYVRTGTSDDIMALDPATKEVSPVLASRFTERQARISPDGKWLVYTSDESGRSEIYVQAWPDLTGRVTVSTEGGAEPVWSRDSRRLYYRTDTDIMVATIVGTNPLELTTPEAVFADRFVRTQGLNHTHFDQGEDGRFLMITQANNSQVDATVERRRLVIVANWIEELKRLVPGR